MDDELTVATLRRWESGGGTWRTVHLGADAAEVELCACTGEAMERVRGTGWALLGYLAVRPDSEVPEPAAPADNER